MTDRKTAYEAACKWARETVSKLTLQEKVAQMSYVTPEIPRLSLKAYTWWNEALHGVARAGLSTVFPQAIGLSATFHPELVKAIGKAIGEEGRIKHALYASEGDHGIYTGLTYWSPNINIVRDPRWGRGHETYGEDPYLTSVMGCGFVQGMQGDDPEENGYLAAACAKHMAAHSGPEAVRHGFNAEVSKRDLYDTYLPAFEHLVKRAKVAGVMSAYNAINHVPCSASSLMLRDLLRDEWGFNGYTVSDCGAIEDISEKHGFAASKLEGAAAAVRGGCNLNCGASYSYLLEAVEKGILEEEAIDEAVYHLFVVRHMLGIDEPVPRESAAEALVCWSEKRQEYLKLSEQAAEESIVLLKNDGILPLHPESPVFQRAKEEGRAPSIAVIGPNAVSADVLYGNYHGTSDELITMLRGIREEFTGARLWYSEGAHLYKDRVEACSPVPGDRLAEAKVYARNADVTILCLGLDPTIEGELGDASNEYAAGDKKDLFLPESQRELLRAVLSVTANVVVVLISGGALDLREDLLRVRGLLQVFYPGERGGKAVAGVLSGRVNPTGRLPLTFYHNEDVTWPAEDYDMKGKTYRYLEKEPLFPYGFGLAYDKLSVDGLSVDAHGAVIRLSNPHDKDVCMPVQLYVHFPDEASAPNRQLVGISKVTLSAGETKEIRMDIDPYWLQVTGEDGVRRPVRGRACFSAFDCQTDERSVLLSGRVPARTEVEL